MWILITVIGSQLLWWLVGAPEMPLMGDRCLLLHVSSLLERSSPIKKSTFTCNLYLVLEDTLPVDNRGK